MADIDAVPYLTEELELAVPANNKRPRAQACFWPMNPWATELSAKTEPDGVVKQLHKKSRVPVLAQGDFCFRPVRALPKQTWDAMQARFSAHLGRNGSAVQLPLDALARVFHYLGTPDLLAASETCVEWFVLSLTLRQQRRKLPALHPWHLTGQQYIVYCRVVYDGLNQYITGNAGTGKSHLIQCLLAALEARDKSVQTVAPMGVAAVRISGMTMHQFVGLNPNKVYPIETYTRRAVQEEPVCLLAKVADVLIIDEVFTASRGLFEAVDVITRCYRRQMQRPFGGLQVICCGDPYQLSAMRESKNFFDGKRPVVPGHVLDSSTWIDCFGTPAAGNRRLAVLTQPMRQARDDRFRRLLDAVRSGRPGYAQEQLLLSRLTATPQRKGLTAPECVALYTHNDRVDKANSDALGKLSTHTSCFNARDSIVYGNRPTVTKLLEQCRMAASLTLKEQCRVMLMRNYSDATLSNGSQGTVRQLIDLTQPAQSEQLLTCLQAGTCGIIGDKRFYLMWTGEQLELCYQNTQNLLRSMVKVKSAHITTLPLVEFDDQPGHLWVVMPCVHEVEVREPIRDGASNKWIYRNVVAATREQLPLALGYAFSIHRAQGMTLSQAKVDLEGCWEMGQVYSALGRLRSLDTLYLLSPPKWDVVCQKALAPEVRQYDARMRVHSVCA
jgi:ATP-dependent DNA helicase PIF1